MRPTIAAAAAAALLAACQTTPTDTQRATAQAQPTPRATAQLQPTQGNKTFGEATFEQVGSRVRVVVFVQGLKPDQEHGMHIHEVGDCSSGDGMSTKGHFNPFGKPHGNPGDAERHAGDLPSLKANKDGRARVDVEIDVITLTGGPGNIIGRGLIVHADPDDFRTQPTGNAGARLACGVIQTG
jgi:Cu-Zn family superoxide dismutase